MMVLLAAALLHQAEADEDHQGQRQPQRMRESEENQRASQHRGRDLQHARQADHRFADSQRKPDTSAPIPEAAVSHPRVYAPPCSTWPAKTGRSTE